MSEKLSDNAKRLQEEYVQKHGKVGERIAKSKLEKEKRYRLHKKAKKSYIVLAKQKTVLLKRGVFKATREATDAVEILVNEYGYNVQSEIL